ncbi:solute:sodium symporter family transporter [Mariniblastus fucicola]|uniref:Putative symporter YidK n=1 Tax=Mariniblastus fucicola TaxID=980251 RepID=A0A5B9PCW9_9BACT|nr:solute:sodium symporter family transporter [Mariniblastus fucicola]QEG22752.1 putative symporter YidK [Mariniblastus fucicola]
MTLTIVSFLFFTALVAFLTWRLTRNTDVHTDEGFFLAGRSLSAIFIAGSLLLTNLSTEQLIGLNAGSFDDGLSLMCWETVAGISLVILALFFLPRYLKSGIATIPQFLEERYDPSVRSVTAGIFIVAYMLILLPFVLYLGATGLDGMLGLKEMFGFSELNTIIAVILFIAVVGAAYAIFGGLKAVAVSDTLNGAGLLVGGLLITFFSLQIVAGEGGFAEAFSKIKAHNPDAFQSMGKAGEDTHWPTLFTGVLMLNFTYWCLNQQIIQRTFGAKNLAEGQKGVLLAAFLKIFGPVILILPGITAAYLTLGAQDPEMVKAMTVDGVVDANQAYGALVSRVLPDWMLGFFAAVIVGSILSTFNSVLNSSATLFSLDVYKKYLNPSAATEKVVRVGQICSFVVAVFAVIAAPIFFHGRDGVFGFFQKLNGVYFTPLCAIMLLAMFNKTVNGKSALITIAVGLGLMSLGTFFSSIGEFDWVLGVFGSGYHYMGAVLVLLLAMQYCLGEFAGMKRATPYEQKNVEAVDLTPWKHASWVGASLVVMVIGIYVWFAQ